MDPGEPETDRPRRKHLPLALCPAKYAEKRCDKEQTTHAVGVDPLITSELLATLRSVLDQLLFGRVVGREPV